MKKLLGFVIAVLALASCEGVDCTLNNMVYCYYGFYSSETGEAIQLTDTLTITAQGTDSILYNKGINCSSVSLPMSFWNDADTLIFHIYNDSISFESLLFVGKTNTQHYESPDCPATMFHQLTTAGWQSSLIDSVVIVRPGVNYLQNENIKIYFRTAP